VWLLSAASEPEGVDDVVAGNAKVTEGRVTGAGSALGRRLLPVGITVVGVAIVVYFTLFPFDLVNGNRSFGEVVGRFRLTTGSVWNWRAMPANVLMLVPLGLGVGGLARARGWSRRATVALGALVGLTLSVGLEVAQAAWLLRDPAFDDIVSNAAGGGLGAWLWVRFGSSLTVVSDRVGAAARSGPGRPVALVLAVVPIVLVMAVTVWTRDDSARLGWDPSSPMMLGNEATGDRPWSGSISEVVITDRALNGREAAAWAAGSPMEEITPGSVLLDLDFAVSAGMPPGWQSQPASSDGRDLFVDGRVVLGPDRWLRSDAAAADLSRRIEASGSFTLAVDAASASTDQSGPARLVSISSDVYERNLTLAQDGPDLVVRVRSPFTGSGGDTPEFAVHGVFADDRPRRIVVTYDASTVGVVVDDGAATSTIDLQPATVPMVAMFPDQLERIRFSSLGNPVREVFLAAFMFGPWCLCVTLLQGRRALRFGSAVLVVAPVIGVEVILTRVLPLHTFRVVHVLVVGGAALLVAASVAAWRVRSERGSPLGSAAAAGPR
jgi:hypothetical protein